MLVAKERRSVGSSTAEWLDGHQRGLAKAAPSAAAQQEVKATAREITSLTKPESERSAVAKWCSRFCNRPALQRLTA